MLAQWTGTLVGKMHIYEISHKELAAAVGWHPKYMSVVINGHKHPAGAEQTLMGALDRLIAEKEGA